MDVGIELKTPLRSTNEPAEGSSGSPTVGPQGGHLLPGISGLDVGIADGDPTGGAGLPGSVRRALVQRFVRDVLYDDRLMTTRRSVRCSSAHVD
jgi:hypothetical protein